MKLCRISHTSFPDQRYALAEGEQVKILPSNFDLRQPVLDSTTSVSLAEVSLLPPVRPSKIVCVGRNYREHAAELGHDVPKEPLIFFKPTSALLPPGGTVRRPRISERVDYEGELGVVIGKTCYQPAPDADIRQYILGYTCVNDVTARDLQNKDGQWMGAKGFDTFCPVGPVVTDASDPWAGVGVETRVN